MVEDRGDPAQDLAIHHPAQVGEEVLGAHADLLGSLVVGAVDDGHRALEGADHRDVLVVVRLGSSSRGGAASTGAASASVPFSISRFMLILKRRSVGELADGLGARQPAWSTSSVPRQPELGVGRRRDREPEVELGVRR